MQGGFNSLDNFLFTAQDFQRTNQSSLFNRLKSLRVTALNFYTETLIWLCNNPVSIVPPPKIYEEADSLSRNSVNSEQINPILSSSMQQDFTKYKILTHGVVANVLTSSFQKLGVTPLELEREAFIGKTILISNGVDTKVVKLGRDKSVLDIVF
jgi:hypothetical protein